MSLDYSGAFRCFAFYQNLLIVEVLIPLQPKEGNPDAGGGHPIFSAGNELDGLNR